ncbi:MAG: MATE family efflux transporter [Lachnospiraceae bacterium]|nr:MATE family efflux transporter [Lachnospiraceae bacterium]
MLIEKGKKSDIDMTEGVIYRQILRFFFPLLGSSFFQQLYNTADAVIVGHYAGKIALSAVGSSTGALLSMFVGFFISMTSGAAVVVSQYYGARRNRDVRKTVHTSILLTLGIGIAVTITGILFTPGMLRIIGTPDELMTVSATYMRIFFLGMTANLLYNMSAAILRAVGDSRRPLLFLMLSCLINIALDLLFVVKFRMGVAGAAYATVICQIISASLALFVLFHTDAPYGLRWKEFRISPHHAAKILRIGLPSGAQSLMYTFANVIVQSGINSFGTDTVAAWTAYGKIDLLYWMLMASLGTSIMTFVGQNYGAGNIERVRRGVRISALMTTTVSILSSIVVLVFSTPLLSIFTNDPDVIRIGTTMIHMITPAYITYNLIEVFTGALRGMGESFRPLLISLGSICALRIIWMLTVVPATASLKVLTLCYPLSWLTASVGYFLYYRHFMRIRLPSSAFPDKRDYYR